VTEAELLGAVVQAARLCGWWTAHFRPARTARGWRTPVAADGAGFPDLVLARAGELLFAELKSAGGRVSPAQRVWLDGSIIARLQRAVPEEVFEAPGVRPPGAGIAGRAGVAAGAPAPPGGAR
jgi:hypothetical protein